MWLDLVSFSVGVMVSIPGMECRANQSKGYLLSKYSRVVVDTNPLDFKVNHILLNEEKEVKSKCIIIIL